MTEITVSRHSEWDEQNSQVRALFTIADCLIARERGRFTDKEVAVCSKGDMYSPPTPFAVIKLTIDGISYHISARVCP